MSDNTERTNTVPDVPTNTVPDVPTNTVPDALSEKRKLYVEQQQRFRDSEAGLEALKRKIEAEKETAIHHEKAAMEKEFGKKIRSIEYKTDDAERRRRNARTGAVKDRVKNQTAGLRSENAGYRSEIRTILKENGLSRLCGTKLFMSLYTPSGFKEVLTMILTFLIVLVGLPFLVTLFIEATWLKILVFAVMDVLFILLYFVIYGNTTGKKPRAIGSCRGLMNKIKINEKEIIGITRKIQKDPDDSCYNLNSYDAELTRFNQEKNDIVLAKQEAQAELENVTIPKIKEKIDGTYAQELQRLQQEFRESSESTKQLAAEIMTMQGTDPEGPGPETKG